MVAPARFQFSPFNFQLVSTFYFQMTREEIQKEIEQQRKLLLNYEELEVDMEDDAAYIARGNGFCDAKYSEDFLQGQADKIRARIAELEGMMG